MAGNAPGFMIGHVSWAYGLILKHNRAVSLARHWPIKLPTDAVTDPITLSSYQMILCWHQQPIKSSLSNNKCAPVVPAPQAEQAPSRHPGPIVSAGVSSPWYPAFGNTVVFCFVWGCVY